MEKILKQSSLLVVLNNRKIIHDGDWPDLESQWIG